MSKCLHSQGLNSDWYTHTHTHDWHQQPVCDYSSWRSVWLLLPRWQEMTDGCELRLIRGQLCDWFSWSHLAHTHSYWLKFVLSAYDIENNVKKELVKDQIMWSVSCQLQTFKQLMTIEKNHISKTQLHNIELLQLAIGQTSWELLGRRFNTSLA